jgi:hypothetical protein
MRVIVPLAILFLAIGIRMVGITWGLPSKDFPVVPHFDETFMMDAYRSLDYAKGDFTPAEAHREGTLVYYAQQLVIAAAKVCGFVGVYPDKVAEFTTDYSRMILLGRLVSVAFDLGAVVLVYLTIRRMRFPWQFACLGAAIMALAPFEVIYSHYARNHMAANFFVALTMFLSVMLIQSLGWKIAGLAGFAVGLGVATKYSTLLAVTLPIVSIVYDELFRKQKAKLGLFALCGSVFNRRLVVLLIGVAAGFVLADPMLFFDFHKAAGPIVSQIGVGDFNQFSMSSLANLTKLWEYISVLLPKGLGPFLWIALYASFGFVLFLRKYWIYSLPLVIFTMVVVYFMGKGYFSDAEFVRTLLMTFPPLAVLGAISGSVLWKKLQGRIGRTVYVCVLSVVLGGTFLYDAAYVKGMTMPDPRRTLVEHLEQNNLGRPLQVGIFAYSWRTELVTAFLHMFEPSGKFKITVIPLNAPSDIVESFENSMDAICVLDFMMGDPAQELIERLTADGRFRMEAQMRIPLAFAGVNFDEALPHDMAYPFPKFFVLRAVKPQGGL